MEFGRHLTGHSLVTTQRDMTKIGHFKGLLRSRTLKKKSVKEILTPLNCVIRGTLILRRMVAGLQYFQDHLGSLTDSEGSNIDMCISGYK